jgi:hypothetical protein
MWSLVGFASGYSVARLQAFSPLRMRRRRMAEPGSNGSRLANHRLTIVLLVLGLGTAGQGAYFSWERAKTADCQAAVNVQLLESLNASTRAGKEYRDQTNEIWRYILTNSGRNQAEVRQKFTEYLDGQERQEKQRAADPLPAAGDLQRC